jgi:hypothetical protein
MPSEVTALVSPNRHLPITSDRLAQLPITSDHFHDCFVMICLVKTDM